MKGPLIWPRIVDIKISADKDSMQRTISRYPVFPLGGNTERINPAAGQKDFMLEFPHFNFNFYLSVIHY